MIRGHTAPIVDVKWSPYKTNILATASEDATIKIWDIPQEGITTDLKTETQTLTGHLKKVGLINWHPTVFEVIASGGLDNKLNLWNIITGESLHSFSFNDSLMSLEWNNVGSLIATTTKDKNVNIVDPRGNKVENVISF
jgi:WD40 repeat protein